MLDLHIPEFEAFFVPRHGRDSVLFHGHRLDPIEYQMYSVDLKEVQLLDLEQHLNSPLVRMGWQKGDTLTLVTSPTNTGESYDEFLAESGVIVNWAGKTSVLPKRLTRGLSMREVVCPIDPIQLMEGIEMVDDATFTIDMIDEAKKEMLLDGCIAVRKSFVLKLMKDNGINVRKLFKAKALSISILTTTGQVKALAYIVRDKDWKGGKEKFIMTSKANVKAELMSDEHISWISWDFVREYDTPKTNPQLDIMLGNMIQYPAVKGPDNATVHQGSNFKWALRATLGRSAQEIKAGTFVKAEFSPDDVNPEANLDFVLLGNQLADFKVRGLDYRWSPTLVKMAATAESRQWWDDRKGWARYPLINAISAPVITESAAAMLGHHITVKKGEIRAIKNGKVWVVNDLDFVTYIAFNAGGSDLDDVYVLLFFTVEGSKKVMLARNPMSWGEFSILDYHEGDPHPTWINATGGEIAFPPLPGKVMPTLSERVSSGKTTIIGLPAPTPKVVLPTFNVDKLLVSAKEFIDNELGDVGGIVNAVILAADQRPELLEHSILDTMEQCIDAYTKEGNTQAQEQLVAWAESLIADVGQGRVDGTLWRKRVPAKIRRKINARTYEGKHKDWLDINIQLRTNFENEIEVWAQRNATAGNPLVSKLETLFATKRADVAISTNPWVQRAKVCVTSFKSNMSTVLNVADPTATRDEKKATTAAQWRQIYAALDRRLEALSGGDEKAKELIVVAMWFYCMSSPSAMKKTYSDKPVVNPTAWPLFMGGLVNLGLALDLGDGTQRIGWELICKNCGVKFTSMNARTYLTYVNNKGLCKNCRD